MPLQDYDPAKPSRNDVFHTHGYTGAQAGSSLGASSTETFAQRRTLGRNRQFVRQYSGMNHVHSRPGLQKPGGVSSLINQRTPTTPISVPNRRASGFQEPTTRSYNPYS